MSDLPAAPLEDEPRTPMWLPALGAALFVGVGLWWAVTPAALPVVVVPAATASAPVASAAPVASVAPVVPVASVTPPPAPVLGALPASPGRPPRGSSPGGPAPDPRLHRLAAPLRLKGAAAQP